MALDHFTIVTITDEGPSIANLKLEGVLNKARSLVMEGICVFKLPNVKNGNNN